VPPFDQAELSQFPEPVLRASKGAEEESLELFGKQNLVLVDREEYRAVARGKAIGRIDGSLFFGGAGGRPVFMHSSPLLGVVLDQKEGIRPA
jgi:hypothetical protein